MRLWIVQVQGGNRHWIPWATELSEEEADACADNTNRMTGWETRVEEFIPSTAADNIFDLMLSTAFKAAEAHGIERREFAASLQKYENFRTLDKRRWRKEPQPIKQAVYSPEVEKDLDSYQRGL